jgi:hypothetical protein
MLLPKNILYIPDYKFPDGSIKPKFLLVLAYNDSTNTSIIYTLTTSQDKYVSDIDKKNGCINDKKRKISMFVFEKNRIVGTKLDGQPFSFDRDYTFVKANNNIIAITTEKLISKYGQIMELKATFDDKTYKRLIKCLRQSEFLPNEFKELFENITK